MPLHHPGHFACLQAEDDILILLLDSFSLQVSALEPENANISNWVLQILKVFTGMQDCIHFYFDNGCIVYIYVSAVQKKETHIKTYLILGRFECFHNNMILVILPRQRNCELRWVV